MQVDLKSECFTPESRPNKDFTKDSLNSNWPKCTGKLSNKKQCVKQPDSVQCYNEGMFGVDKSNQYLSRYPCYIKSKFQLRTAPIT
jgi:hypothetical protein